LTGLTHSQPRAKESYLPALTTWLFTLAAGSLLLGALLYKSTNPVILNRYSLTWFSFVCAGLLAVVALALLAAHKTGCPQESKGSKDRTSAKYAFVLSLAAACWGASVLTQYLVDSQHFNRLLSGEIFGATQTPGIMLEYLAQVIVGAGVLRCLVGRALRIEGSRHSWRSGVLLALSSVALVYLLAEGTTRVANILSPQPQGAPTKPAWIWHYRYVHLNARGYRDREFSGRSDPKELRILAIGDSFVYGWGVPDPRDRLTGVLASQISAKKAFPAVSVFNAGVPATHSVDHLKNLRSLLWLKPDLVLLVYVFNDIEHVSPPPPDPVFAPISRIGRLSPRRLLMLNSHLFDQLLLRYRAYASSSGTDHFLNAYRDPDSLRQHLDVLVQIQQTTEAAGIAFRLVPFDVATQRAQAYADRYQRFVQACRERGLPVWFMARTFDGFAFTALTVNQWDRHPNELAHHLAGEFLVEQVLREKMVIVKGREHQLDPPVQKTASVAGGPLPGGRH